ncbi:cyanophycinase [Clostridium tarantellae]|uniref:Cyanophycinase n=1 Tax=Clostridium tarantellae TaxID=39493 RepID=A0A6I1MIQ5_9CLOT|nr:cyanophycinase [Clostridium tarantellae]MPQ43010.1 cyanophycinase [Clostridium tarantellae]
MRIDINSSLIIIGGAEDKENKKKILAYVANKAKELGCILIVTVATEFPESVGKQYNDIFTKLGVNQIKELHVKDREHCYNEKNIKLVKEAAVIFFTGGDQLRITSILGGTPIYQEMIEACKRKCVFVGTSAGASVMSDTMIVGGGNDESPRKCTLKMAPGLGLIENIIIDQHFAQRGRIGRLLSVISQNPSVLGIGIDEDTAIVVEANGMLTVIGTGAVYIIDGREITYTNVSEQYEDKLLTMFNVKLHVLTPGKKFNLITRVPFQGGKN